MNFFNTTEAEERTTDERLTKLNELMYEHDWNTRYAIKRNKSADMRVTANFYFLLCSSEYALATWNSESLINKCEPVEIDRNLHGVCVIGESELREIITDLITDLDPESWPHL